MVKNDMGGEMPLCQRCSEVDGYGEEVLMKSQHPFPLS